MKTFLKSLILLSLGSMTTWADTASSANYQMTATAFETGGTATNGNVTFTQVAIGGIYGTASSANYTMGAGNAEQVASIEQSDGAIDLRDYNSWKTQFFTAGQPNSNREDDFDKDGVSNEDEFLALTDPTDPNSQLVFQILSVNFNKGEANLSFSPYEQNSSLRHYTVQASGDLSDNFTAINGSLEAGPNGTGLFNDGDADNANGNPTTRKFYRLLIEIP